jgi:hypothetical protein
LSFEFAWLLVVTLAQSPCATHSALVAAATDRAAVFDLSGAAKRLTEGISSCPQTAVAYWYVHGLMAAREAYRFGGSPESLVPVKRAMTELESRAGEIQAAEIARVLLQAASSAAQSEREELRVLLEHALGLEEKARAAGLPGAPVVSAYEVAGDLWLQVHRFDDAHRAYVTAGEQVGFTRRVTLGLGRTASRLGDLPTACDRYRTLVSGWPKAGGAPSELAEARTFLRRPECRARSAPPR